MSEQINRPRPVVAPAGEPLTLDDLPAPDLKRWVTRRKAQVVAAVRAGLIGLDQACTRYGITIEEFLSRQRLLDEYGLHGLRVTRLQDYRRPPNRTLRPATLTLDKRPLGPQILVALPRPVGRLTPKRRWST